MYRYLLGYDCRLRYGEYVHVIWNSNVRDIHLIINDIKWPLSVDVSIWPSAFDYISSMKLGVKPEQYSWIDIDTDSFLHRNLRLWQDYEKMVDCLVHNKSLNKGIVTMLVLNTVMPSSEYEYFKALDLSKNIIIDDESLHIPELLKDWDLLGYDIANCYMLSGLSNCGYTIREKDKMKEVWGQRLNKYGLISKYEYAENMREITDIRVKEHSPFFVYSIYCKSNLYSDGNHLTPPQSGTLR